MPMITLDTYVPNIGTLIYKEILINLKREQKTIYNGRGHNTPLLLMDESSRQKKIIKETLTLNDSYLLFF